MKKTNLVLVAVPAALIILLSACSPQPPIPTIDPGPQATPTPTQTAPPGPDLTTPTPVPYESRQLTICLGQEPRSLFLYGDSSRAATAVRQALFEGASAATSGQAESSILENRPTLANGGARLEEVEVQQGEVVQAADGSYVSLSEGTVYLPAGCREQACAKTYRTGEPAFMDQLVVQFKLRPGITWSDGKILTAADSVFAYQVARSLYPGYRPDLIERTASYTAIDEQTTEWRAVPALIDPRYYTNFYPPLPQHALGNLSPEEMLSDPVSTRNPIGWGPYILEEWVSGDQITLTRNSGYFRAGEGLPHFDKLVFRFVADGKDALEALSSGKCDLADPSTRINPLDSQLAQLAQEGRISLTILEGTAWEQLVFGIQGWQEEKPSLFSQKEVRQAVAMCIDRERLARELLPAGSPVPRTYLPPGHPLYNPEAQNYSFDPVQAAARLEAAGWVDHDGNASTPRQSSIVPGYVTGTPFEFTYLAANDPVRLKAAEIVKESLAQCGLKANIEGHDINSMLSSGPGGPVFGRLFEAAQFGWVSSPEPACALYTTSEIPGPYPAYPKGWGGSNAAGYSNTFYDQACRQALSSLPDWDSYSEGHLQAQAIYAEDLPSLPLYFHNEVVATRPDMCGVIPAFLPATPLDNLASFDYGEGCP